MGGGVLSCFSRGVRDVDVNCLSPISDSRAISTVASRDIKLAENYCGHRRGMEASLIQRLHERTGSRIEELNHYSLFLILIAYVQRVVF